MTPREFIEKWRDNPLKERASYQMHFFDLCALLGVPPPSPSSHETYCFERGATRTGAGRGWADVWKRGCFGFEYKALHRSLAEALKQLMTYALALDNPPLLVVCDTNLIEIHTHFTNAPSEIHTIALEEIGEPANLEKLRWLFVAPDKFHPGHTIAQITEEAAGKFAALAQSLNGGGHEPQRVAHFLNQCLFCLFAEDAELLPGRLGAGNDPRYTPTTTFETFPFPGGLTPADTAPSVRPELVEGRVDAQTVHASTRSARTEAGNAIATAAQTLNQLRDNWLNPPEWAVWVRTPEEEKAGYPARPVARVEGDAGRDSSRHVGLESDLQKRTLTNLYNARPAWLDNACKALDAAVAQAYGWNDYTPEMPDEEILRRLLALNLAQ